MTKIVFNDQNNNVNVVGVASGFDLATVMAEVVPSGLQGFIVDDSSLPNGPLAQWRLDDSGNLTLAVYVPTAADVDAERDRRLYGGFLFNSVPYQTDEVSIANILGSSQLAFMAIVAGAQAGNYEWTGASTPFLYIAADNSKQQMDAQTVVNFAKAAAAFRSTIIYMGRAAKDALAAGQTVDVTADATWAMDSTSPTSTAKAPSAASSTTTATTTASGTSGATAPSQAQSS